MAYSAIPITPFGGAGGDGKRIKSTWTVSPGHPFVAGNVVRYTGSGFALAQADSLTNVQSVGIVESATGTTITVVYQGEIEFGTAALTSIVGGAGSLVSGTIYYISLTNAGMLDPNMQSGGYVKGIMVATGAKKGIVVNSLQESQLSVGGVSINTVGMIVPWAGPASTIPENWKLCDGEAVAKVGENPIDSKDYSELYAVIGDKYHVSALVDNITGASSEDMIVSFLHGHMEKNPAKCHGLCNAWDNDSNLDYKIGWGGTNDYAVATIVLADAASETVRFRFKASYPGTSPITDWSVSGLGVGLPITIQSLDNGEIAGFTSDRFFIPDMRARSVFGVGYSTGLSETLRGQMGGSEVHLLTTSEIPDHNNVVFTTDSPTQSGGEVEAINAGITFTSTYETLGASFTADNTPLSLMPPYLATNWIIRFSGVDLAPFGPTGPEGQKGSTGATGPTGQPGGSGAAGSTGFGYTAAHISGDGNLYMSVLFPNGASGQPFSLGTVVGQSTAVGGQAQQMLFKGEAETVTGSSNFVFDGTSATFGGEGTRFTATGPTFAFGKTTRIVDGIFVNPQEDSHYANNGSNNLLISGLNGTIQRFTVSPLPDFTVGVTSTSGHWNDTTNVVQTVNVVLQSTNGITGTFASDILCPDPRPVFCGVTGGVDLLSIMRIKTAAGNVTMGFVVASGMTAAGISIAN